MFGSVFAKRQETIDLGIDSKDPYAVLSPEGKKELFQTLRNLAYSRRQAEAKMLSDPRLY